MTAFVVDASVAVKWVVDEEGSTTAASLARHRLLAPDLLMVECANALWAKQRRGELDDSEVVERVQALRAVPVDLVPQQELLEEAVALALKLEHPVYDCLYLALAVEQDTALITADRLFVATVRRHDESIAEIWLLDEYARRAPSEGKTKSEQDPEPS